MAANRAVIPQRTLGPRVRSPERLVSQWPLHWQQGLARHADAHHLERGRKVYDERVGRRANAFADDFWKGLQVAQAAAHVFSSVSSCLLSVPVWQ
jgi:hypothetical protein